MKSILNFRHKIEKYGFLCTEFRKAHPCPQLGMDQGSEFECELQ